MVIAESNGNMDGLCIGFIGLGLIGGSIAQSIRMFYPEYRIIAYNRSEKARRLALEDGTADVVCDSIDNTFSQCDYIFLCTPVKHNVEYINMLKEVIKDGCIITDVGSVKNNIHKAIAEAEMERHFIGGHPMAGSEKTGYENASPYLVKNAYYVLTPEKETPVEKLKELTDIVNKIGAIPVVLNCDEHDYAVAAISHLPHLIAASLVKLVKDSDSEKETMKTLAAGGFKDITRIASSSPEVWEQIFSANSENVVSLLGDYIHLLESLKKSLENDDTFAISDLFEKSRAYRNSFKDIK